VTTSAVLTAAGMGTRLGHGQPKALVLVAGRPLVAHALERLLQVADSVVVTAPASHIAEFYEAVEAVPHADGRAFVVAGADTRQGSVAVGLAALVDAGVAGTVVVIHDAARAFQPVATMARAVAAVHAGADGAVPVVPLVDTLVMASEVDGTLGEGVDREALRAVQTPQVFRTDAIVDAHARAACDPQALSATDDATVARRYGYRVVATEGHPWGFKVTTAGDLALAAYVAGEV